MNDAICITISTVIRNANIIPVIVLMGTQPNAVTQQFQSNDATVPQKKYSLFSEKKNNIWGCFFHGTVVHAHDEKPVGDLSLSHGLLYNVHVCATPCL